MRVPGSRRSQWRRADGSQGPVAAAQYPAGCSHGHRWFSDQRTKVTTVELELMSVGTTGVLTRGILEGALILGKERFLSGVHGNHRRTSYAAKESDAPMGDDNG